VAVFLAITTFNNSVSTSTAQGAEHKHRYGPTVEALCLERKWLQGENRKGEDDKNKRIKGKNGRKRTMTMMKGNTMPLHKNHLSSLMSSN
jgi:hypothetical protein